MLITTRLPAADVGKRSIGLSRGLGLSQVRCHSCTRMRRPTPPVVRCAQVTSVHTRVFIFYKCGTQATDFLGCL